MKAALRYAILVSCLAAVACKPAETAKRAPARKAELVKVRVNLTPSLSNAQLMIAKEEGDFAKEGLDVELVSLDNNSANMAIGTGELDVMAAPMRTGIFNLIARGEAVQVVADKGHSEPGPCAAEAFTAPAGMAARIAAKGFRGERFALVRGGIMEYLIDRMLEREKLTRADIEVVQLPQGDYASSSRQEADALRYMMEPVLSNALSRGGTEIVAPIEEIAPGTQLAMIVYGRRLLRDEPELGHRFMRAYLRGVRRYLEGKSDRNVAIVSKYTKLPPDIVRRACWPHVAGDGRVEPSAVLPFLAWGRKNGYMDADVPVSAWWNPTFVEAVHAAR